MGSLQLESRSSSWAMGASNRSTPPLLLLLFSPPPPPEAAAEVVPVALLLLPSAGTSLDERLSGKERTEQLL